MDDCPVYSLGVYRLRAERFYISSIEQERHSWFFVRLHGCRHRQLPHRLEPTHALKVTRLC